MRSWITALAFVGLILLFGTGCGKSDKSSADKAAEVQKAIQEGMQKEKQMYEGMQKGVENLEKAVKEQKEKGK